MDALVESELTQALGEPGCVLCRIGEASASRYLRFVLHESVNDPALRRRLLAAWGFCRRHAWHFQRLDAATLRDGPGTAILAEGLIEAVQHVLGGPRLARVRDGLEPSAECPACSRQREHEAYAASVLVRVLDDAAWRERLTRSDGLCLGHLREVLAAAGASSASESILADHRKRLDALLGELKDYIRKHDYRFVGELAATDHDAVLRATTALAGSWFELPAASAVPARGTADET